MLIVLLSLACGGGSRESTTPNAQTSLERANCTGENGMPREAFLSTFETAFVGIWCPGVGAGCFQHAQEQCSSLVHDALAQCSASLTLPSYVCGEEHAEAVGTVLGECLGSAYERSNPSAMACPRSQACTEALTQLGQDATCP